MMAQAGHQWRQTTTAKTEAGQRPIRVNEIVDLARLFSPPPGDLLATGQQAVSRAAADDSARGAMPSTQMLLLKVQRDRALVEIQDLEQSLLRVKAEEAEVETKLTDTKARLDRLEDEMAALVKRGDHLFASSRDD
jgi:hypothetical protein